MQRPPLTWTLHTSPVIECSRPSGCGSRHRFDESMSVEALVFVIDDDLLHLIDGHREVSVLHHRVREEEII